MLKYLLPPLFLSASLLMAQSEPIRVPVIVQEKIGYIDENGVLAIFPRFLSGGAFSNGLAPVREMGFYGYIDSAGDYMIPPSYDYAEPFQNGLALVWSGGLPQVIDTEGCPLFLSTYEEIFPFGGKTYTTVRSEGGKYGLIDIQGKLLMDTILSFPLKFDEAGLAAAAAAAAELDQSASSHKGDLLGIVDTNGHFVLPLQRLRRLSALGHGYYELIYPKKWNSDESEPSAIICPNGKVSVQFNGYKWSPDEGHGVSGNGITPAVIYDVDLSKLRTWSANDRISHAALISYDGRVIADHPEWEFVSSFSTGRAFAYDTNHRYWLIDESGEKLLETSFLSVAGLDESGWGQSVFNDGQAVVRRGRYWFLMDRDLQLTPLPDFGEGVTLSRSDDDVLLLTKLIKDEEGYHKSLHGWYDLNYCTLILPKYGAEVRKVSGTELFFTQIDGEWVYLDRSGKVVWREEKRDAAGKRNIDFMERADFTARERSPGELSDILLRFPDYNPNLTIPWSKSLLMQTGLQLTTRTEDDIYHIQLVNSTVDTLWFPAQDGIIELIMQAKNEEGEWLDIQYLGQSWCGNSYHTLALPAQHAWSFRLPVYDGAFRTELRTKLTYISGIYSRERLTIFGNSVTGAVNPGQFWRKPTYQPAGLMDPYY